MSASTFCTTPIVPGASLHAGLPTLAQLTLFRSLCANAWRRGVCQSDDMFNGGFVSKNVNVKTSVNYYINSSPTFLHISVRRASYFYHVCGNLFWFKIGAQVKACARQFIASWHLGIAKRVRCIVREANVVFHFLVKRLPTR